MITRNRFLAGFPAAAAAAALPLRAWASGGLDIGVEGEVPAQIRVLLASGSFASAAPIDGWHFAWNGRSFRGTFASVALPGGRSGLVNTLPLDAYLYGVLSKEISSSWASAAQQAQAIVTRTYTLAKLRPERVYDVVAGDADQNYGGLDGESIEGRAAVDATASTVVSFDGKPAQVAYSACCGGRTADAADIWDSKFPYLGGVVDPNCAGAPNFNWETTVAVDALLRALGRDASACGRLHDIALRSDGRDSRPHAVAFVGDAGALELSIGSFRARVGPSVVRSSYVRQAVFDAKQNTLALAGTGRGHGVGLCQWGARALGSAGRTAQDIVAFYFPGTTLGRA